MSYNIEVEKTCGFILVLKDAEKTVPYDWEWIVNPVPLDGSNLFVGFGIKYYTDGGCRFTVNRPGYYKFKLPKIPGYQPVPEQKIYVKSGKLVEHIIHLKREY